MLITVYKVNAMCTFSCEKVHMAKVSEALGCTKKHFMVYGVGKNLQEDQVMRYLVILFFLTCLPAMGFGASRPSQQRAISPRKHAVTYTFSGGRFGDNLISYLHAKWISYHYGIPLLYKPFPYSDELMLHYVEKSHKTFQHRYKKSISIKKEKDLHIKARHAPTLFVLTYFPESAWERKHSRNGTKNGTEHWHYLPTNWEDPGFRKILKKVIYPVNTREKYTLPADCITVALHIRRGGGMDTEHTFRHAPLKFPQDNFYIAQLRWLAKFFAPQKLYVHIFTDDDNPGKMQEVYEKALKGLPIEFNSRKEGNKHNVNVLEDFFALTQFDCSIHGESNFPVTAGKICDYLVEIEPTKCHWRKNTLIIDEVLRCVRKKQLKKYLSQESIREILRKYKQQIHVIP